MRLNTFNDKGHFVGQIKNWSQMRIGASHPAFIWQGDTLLYPNPVKDGLVLWYDFSGMTNTDHNRGTAHDLSGNGNHGTLQNFNFTPESGYDKNKLLFDGVDDYTTFKNAENWIDTGKITVESTIQTNNNSVNMVIASNDYTNFELSKLPTGGIQFYYSDGTTTNYEQPRISGNVGDGLRHHIVGIFHKDLSKVELYVDGKKMGEQISGRGLDMTGFSPSSFDVGRRPGGERPFEGFIYSTKIYNRTLTPEEIAHNYEIEKERFGIE